MRHSDDGADEAEHRQHPLGVGERVGGDSNRILFSGGQAIVLSHPDRAPEGRVPVHVRALGYSFNHDHQATDGLKTGVNVPFTAELANTVSIPIIASGGVKSVDDIRALRASGAPIAGTILGRALYDGDIDAGEAVRAAS